MLAHLKSVFLWNTLVNNLHRKVLYTSVIPPGDTQSNYMYIHLGIFMQIPFRDVMERSGFCEMRLVCSTPRGELAINAMPQDEGLKVQHKV